MKNSLIAIILFSLCLASVSRSGVYLSYKVFQEFVIENFCENKNKPELNCNGQCFLMKQLKKAKGQEESNKMEVQVFVGHAICEMPQDYSISPIFVDNILHKGYYLNFYTSDNSFSLFRPPCIS